MRPHWVVAGQASAKRAVMRVGCDRVRHGLALSRAHVHREHPGHVVCAVWDLVVTKTPCLDREPVCRLKPICGFRSRKPPLVVAIRNFLLQPIAENLYRDKDFSIATENQNSLSQQRTKNGQ